MIPAFGILNRHIVIRQRQQFAAVSLTTGFRYRSSSLPLLRIKKTSLQNISGVLSRNSSKVACRRMAGRTSANTLEERFTRVCVAREELIRGALQISVC